MIMAQPMFAEEKSKSVDYYLSMNKWESLEWPVYHFPGLYWVSRENNAGD